MENIINDNMDSSAEPVMAERVVASVNDKSSASVKSSKKGKNGMLVGLIFCILVSLGAIGFGAWAIIDAYQQISDLKSQVTTLEEQLSDVTDIDTADYIYVGEWGLKIKTSDELENLSYMVKSSNDSDATLCITGLVKYDGRIPDFANFQQNPSGLICVRRQAKDSDNNPWNDVGKSTLVFSDDSYNFFANGGLAMFSNVDSEMYSLEEQSRAAIAKILSDTGNWSTILLNK